MIKDLRKKIFSQGLLLVFAWRLLDYSLFLQHEHLTLLNYEKVNDDTDGCRIRHHSKRSVQHQLLQPVW